MTPKQTTFYWSLWRDCCQANCWRMERGRLLHDPERLNEMGKKVWTAAEQLALAAHRAVSLDDLRHGCHLVALGRQRSSKDLSNPEFNKVRLVFQLTQDWENLDAQMELANPEMVERRSFVSYLKKQFHEAALIAICKNAFGTIFWEDLEMSKLRWLAKQGSLRTATPRKTFYRRQLAAVEGGARREYETDPAKVPF